MSEFHIHVVRIGALKRHENADSLSITYIHGGYPCIVRTGELQEGDKAVYIPVDALVNTNTPTFAFLASKANKDGWYRIRAMRLRGVFSMGLLIPAPPEWEIGQDVRKLLDIEKWEPPEPDQEENEKDPGILPEYDIEGLRRWPELLVPGEEVVLTEKVHGANGRAVFADGRLYVGSRTRFKRPEGTSIWAIVARQAKLAEILQDKPWAFYFEVYGAVQDLRYGMGPGMARLALFDVLDWKSRRWLDHSEVEAISAQTGIPMVPVLYRGPWSMDLAALAEGTTVIGDGKNVREGFVVKPIHERFDERIGRVILKLHGEGYLTRKGG